MAQGPPPRSHRQTQLTSRGLVLLAFSILLMIPGVLMGSGELVSICLVLIAVVGIAYATERFLRSPQLRSLSVAPDSISVGEALVFTPQFRGYKTNWRISFAPHPRLASATELPRGNWVYRTIAQNRGSYEVGTVSAVREDILGLARTSKRWNLSQQVTIYPRLFDLSVPRPASVPGGGSALFQSSGSSDDVSLRAYVPGDEIRRIHWTATARQGEVMVRSEETSTQNTLTLVVDNRSCANDHQSLEWIISVATSVAVAAVEHRWTVRIIHASDSVAPGAAAVFTQSQDVLDYAAALRPAQNAQLAPACAQFATTDLTIACLQQLDADADHGVGHFPRMGGVLIYRNPNSPPTASAPGVSHRFQMMHLSPEEDVEQAWQKFSAAAL